MDTELLVKFEHLLYRLGTAQGDKSDKNEMFELTLILIESKRFDDAIACLRLAVFYELEIYQFWSILSKLYEIQGDWSNAEVTSKQAFLIFTNQHSEPAADLPFSREVIRYTEYVN